MAYDLPVAQHSSAVRIYNATREWGVYSHGAMLSFYGGIFGKFAGAICFFGCDPCESDAGENLLREWTFSDKLLVLTVATWKNGVLSEDKPGQRVLWSYATAEAPLNYSKVSHKNHNSKPIGSHNTVVRF